jgi:hypothetical protein
VVVFDSTIWNVALGLGFVFFAFSLIASGVNELVRKALNTRAKALWKALKQILETGREPFRGGGDRLGIALADGAPIKPEPERAVGSLTAGGVLAHPIILSLDPTHHGRKSRLSFIPPREFASVAVDILGHGTEGSTLDRIRGAVPSLPEPVRTELLQLLEQAGDRLDEFRDAVEEWFDGRMQRVSDWYKRRTRWALAAYGLFIAVIFNVNAITTTQELWTNDVVSDAVAQLANEQVGILTPAEGSAECGQDCVEADVSRILDTGLPIGWDPACGSEGCSLGDYGRAIWDAVSTGWDSGLLNVLGWLLTAAALAMGATFWFDLLRKAAGLRGGRRSLQSMDIRVKTE